MAKTDLVIVESPAKAKTIGRYLGPNYTVIASMGHIRDLPKSKLGVDIEADFQPDYQPIKGKEDIIKSLRKAAKNSNRVYLATDPDREGEAISWHLKELLELPDDRTYRVTFNEITKTVVNESIAAPRAIDQDLVDAQQARRILDRIVGYQLSPLLWRKIRRGLSAGRVQSVATRLVVDRENEIRAFVPQEYWSLDVRLERIAPQVGSFLAHYHGEGKKKAELPNEEAVNAILADVAVNPFVVTGVRKGEKQRQPAPPFTTSTLQQEASRKLGMTPRRTMSIAQQLYEGVDIEGEGAVGLITYMRTDSLRLSVEATDSARSFIRARYGAAYVPANTRVYKAKANAQDAHEAIRPTNVELAPDVARKSLTSDQYKLYKLIWSRFLACQMSNAVFDTVSIDVTSGTHLFRASHQSMKFSGFTAVYVESKEEGEEAVGSPLPDLAEGETVRKTAEDKAQHFTQPPPRFTEATLIKLLEERGIGRPSTYAPTVSTIQDRYYVVKEGRALRPTPLGEVVTQLMEDKFTDIVDPNFTARMESDLDEVERGKEDWKELLRRFYAGFHAEMEQAEKDLDGERIKIPDEVSDEVCDVCGRQMVIKIGKFGRFLACPGYPECTFTKPIVIEMPGKCPKCGGRILKKTSRNGYTYYGCEYNRSPNENMVCDFMTWDVPVKDNCPICGQTMFKKSGRGAKKPFCINEKCENFTPEELRPGYRKPKEKTEDAVSQAAAEAIAAPDKTADKKTAAKKSTTAKKTTAKKSAAKKATTTKAAAKKTPAKKSTAPKDPNKPKRELTAAQRAALERGRAIRQANREAAKQQKSEE
ncbi:MAG: type I DNA topoisomerase [Clostridiales bacterium]|nr:type I DNA topoisomerase [Clostridiales bacterium]